jgi:hypothetical protein
MPSFADSILDVLELCAEEEMIWPDTLWIIAMM